MQKLRASWMLLAGFMASASLVIALSQRTLHRSAPALPLYDWDIPTLVEHLNRAGLHLRLVNTHQEGAIRGNAFLTTTGKELTEFNRLAKDRTWIDAWRGSLYCERLLSERMRADLLSQWGEEFGFSIGPFLFYGDPELLDRVRAALLTGTSAA